MVGFSRNEKFFHKISSSYPVGNGYNYLENIFCYTETEPIYVLFQMHDPYHANNVTKSYLEEIVKLSSLLSLSAMATTRKSMDGLDKDIEVESE